MSLPVNLRGHASGQTAEVLSNSAVCVTQVVTPASDVRASNAQQRKLLVTKFADDAGATGMDVDGSSTAVPYRVKAEDDRIRTLLEVRIIHHATNMNLASNESRRFGPTAAPGLTNGLDFTASQTGVMTSIFADPVQVIGDYYRYASGPNAIVNDVDAIAASTDFLMVTIPFHVPVVLMPGSNDCIDITVQDDLTAAGFVLIEALAYGYQEVL